MKQDGKEIDHQFMVRTKLQAKKWAAEAYAHKGIKFGAVKLYRELRR